MKMGWCVLLLTTAVSLCPAATFIWNGGAESPAWSNAANWVGGVAPANNGTATIVLAGTSQLTPTVDVAWDISSLTFSNSAGAFTLRGSALTIRAGGVTNNSASSQVISNAITLFTNQTWNAAAGSLTIAGNVNNVTNLLTISGSFNSSLSGVLSGTGGLTKTGAGTNFLSGTNTYSGLTTLSAGVLNLQNNSALGSGSTGAIVASGAQLQLSGGVTVTGKPLTLSGTGISTSGALRNLSGSNSWSGTITLAASSTINADAGRLALEGTIVNTAFTTTFTNLGSIMLNGALGGGAGPVIKYGSGALVLGGTNTYTGATTISGGTVQFTAAGSASSASAVTVNAGSILDLNGYNQSILSLAGAGSVTLGGGALTVNNVAATTYSGVMSGLGSLVKNGTGTMTLSGVNTYAGGTTINAGAISIAAATGLGSATNALTLNGGTLTTTVTLTTAQPITLGANGGTINAGGTTLTLAGTISGPGALTKLGTKALTLTGTNTYLGGTTNVAGTITINSEAALGDSGGALTFSNSATLTTAASFVSTRNIYLNAGTATFNCGTGFTNAFVGVISGAGALTKSGTGVMILNGSSTFTNQLTLSAGTCRLGTNECLSDLLPVVITATTAIFDLNGFNETIGSLASTAAGKVTLGSGFLTAGGNNLSRTNSAVISGTGGFIKAGSGTLVLTGANTYTNTTTIAGGTLQLGASERIANTSSLVISNGATFNLNNFSETVASLAGTGSVSLGSGTLTAGNTGTAEFAGAISGTGAFTKIGTGTQIFSGTNAYSGTTTVSVGSLQVNGSSAASAVTIAATATLSGGGTVGSVAVNNGATDSPGAGAPGTLTSSTQTWATGGNYLWEINNPTGSAGGSSGWDWLNISGTLAINATAASKFNLKLVSLTPANATGLLTNFDNTVTYIWKIASASGGITGFDPSKFNLITAGFQNPLGAGSFALSQSGNDLNLIFSPAAQAAIKGVQSGTLTSTGNGTSTDTLDIPVNPASAFLIFNTRHNNDVPGGSMIRGRLTSSNSVEFVRATTETSPINIQWYVVEYAAGVRVQRGEVSQTNTTINVPLLPLAAVNQAFVTWSKTPDPNEIAFSDSDPVAGEITATTNLQFRVSTAPSAVPVISWQVIEFLNPASINVQKGSVTSLIGTNLQATATLAAPVNTNSTFLLTGYRTSGSGDSIGARMLRAQLTGPSTITFDRSIAGAPDSISEIAWQAIQLNDGSLVQSGSANFQNGIGETNVTLISLNTNHAVAFASVQPAGGQNTGRSPSTGTVLGVGSATMTLASATQLVLDRDNTADSCDAGWFVVGFGPGSLLTPATGGEAISADTATNAYTSLSGPVYTEIQSGNVGTGTVILKAPAGFTFDTNAPQPTVLVSRVGGSGANSQNINGVASGTSAAMTAISTTGLTFTVASVSSNGVTCSLTWQNLRVRPTTGTNLASGNILNMGTAIIQGATTNSISWGFLAEVVGAATKLAIVTQPSSAVTAGVDFPQQPVVQIQDQFGNLRSDDNVSVITATSSGTDTNDVNGFLTVEDGVAVFSGMDYRIAQTNTITFSSPGLTSKTSSNIVVSAAAASQLTLLTQPSATATAGIKFTQQPVVRVEDAFGNLRKTDSTTVVTADINQGSADLTGTLNTIAKNGVATFTNLAYPIAEIISINFTNATLDSDTSLDIVVNPVSQVVTFGSLANKTFGAAPFAVSASASSGLPVAFSILSGPATVAGNLVSLTGAGVVTVRASQPGDATYAAATPVDQAFTVAKAASALVVSTSANPSPTGSNVTFTATVSSGAGTPTGAVQLLADGTALGSPATLSGGIANLTSASLSHGTHTIKAQYAGDGNFIGSTNTLSPNQVINTPPVAAPDQLYRYSDSGVKVRIATLLTNDSDPDGDGLTFVSASATSAAGGTVKVQGGWINYAPPTGFTNADSYSYVIADSFGSRATGTVAITILVVNAPSQNVAGIDTLGNGTTIVQFNGTRGYTYSVQYADNLQAPNWRTLGTATADTTGKFDFADSPPVNSPTRFYRSTYP